MVLVGFKKRTKINFNEKMGEYLKKIYRGSENQDKCGNNKMKNLKKAKNKKNNNKIKEKLGNNMK